MEIASLLIIKFLYFGFCQQLSIYWIYNGYIILFFSANVSKTMPALLRPSLGPYFSEPYQTEPSGLFGPHQRSRCSTDQSGSPEAGTVGETLFSLSPLETSVMPSRPRRPAVARRSPSLLGGAAQSLPPPTHCKRRHVCPGPHPIPLSKRVQRIS